ncbi:MAG: kelch repeat-containing protein [Chthoniobacteraceae bacterium]
MIGSEFHAVGQGSLLWTSGPDLPSPRAEAVALLAPDNAILVMGGTSPSGATVVPKLPNGAASWTTAFDIDTTRIGLGAVRYSTQGILLIGGRSGNAPTDEVLRYDYFLGDSQDAEKMSTGRQLFAYSADGSGGAYAVGGLGESGEVMSSAERYDPVQDAWTGIAPLPAARYGATAVGVGATHIYLFGGATSTAVQATAYRYVIASNSWEVIASMPVAVRNAVAVLTQNRIYVTGGVGASGAVDTVQVYDLATGLWAIDTPLPAARYAHGAAIAASGKILVAGGYDAAGVASASVFQTQQLNIPETAPIFNTSPVTSGSLDRAYGYDAGAVGNPVPTFSLVAAPAGMSIDPISGSIGWQPVAGQVGVHPVTVRATNRAGFADQNFSIAVVADTFAPTPPTELHVVDVTATSVTLAWSGATDATGVDHFAVYRQYRCGWRGSKRCYALVQGSIFDDTVTISGLPPLTSYTYAVRTFDAAGNQSANSPLVTFKTLSPPINFRYTGATSLPANFPLQLQFWVSANPAATFSIVSGPAGLTVDPETGVASWMPSPADVGTHTLMMRATNSGGTADLSVDITVRPDVPVLSVQYVQGAGGFRDAVAGSPWTAQVLDASHTTSTYEIVSAPAGMTIDTVTGQLSWTPTPDNAGLQSVMVRATNAAASTEITMEFYMHFTGPVSSLQVTGLTDLNPTATWSPPVGSGADLTAGYTIVATARYRYGRAYRTHRVTYETDGETPAAVLTGLVSGRTYTLYVNAIDAADNRGLTNAPGLPFVPRPALPNVGWTIGNANGNPGVVAGQEAVVQFTDYNPTFGPASYSVVSAPPGFALDPVTGAGSWTPGATDIGTIPVTVRVTNQIGSRDVTVNILVNFSGPVRNPVATRNGDSAVASWLAPIDNVFPIASYRVTMSWQWGSHRYSRSMTATGTSLAFGLVPTGAVWHKGVYITPIDANGRAGVSTALIPYNGALPTGLPPADLAWIEGVTVGPDGVPVVEVRGEVGAVVAAEVSADLSVWDPLEAVTIDDEGVALCPDSVSQNATQSFYRLRIP